MALQMTTTTTEEVKLKPTVAKKLRMYLQNYQRTALQIKQLKETLAAELFLIEEIREGSGADKFEFEGTKITRVKGFQKRLDQKKLIALGCKADWIASATTEKPKKEYTLVTLPGEKEYGGDE